MKSRSLEAARMLHARIWAERGGTPGARFYTCQFSSWHWTRQLDPQQRAVA